MTRAVLTIVIACSCLMGCAVNPYEIDGYRHYESQSDYRIESDAVTPYGIRVDTSGQEVDLDTIDRMVYEVEECLIETFGSVPVLPESVVSDGDCWDDTFPLPFDLSVLTVKVVGDWRLSCNGERMMINAPAPQEGCDAKVERGVLEPCENGNCICRWQAGLQDMFNVVVPPSMYNFKDPLIRLFTGCNNPWNSPALANCIRPSVGPLPDWYDPEVHAAGHECWQP